MRIPETHKLTLYLVKEILGLEVEIFVEECDNALLFINNQLVTRHVYANDPSTLRFEVEAHEKGLTANELFDRALLTFIKSLDGFEQFDIHDVYHDHTQHDRDRLRRLIAELDQYSLVHTFSKRCAG